MDFDEKLIPLRIPNLRNVRANPLEKFDVDRLNENEESLLAGRIGVEAKSRWLTIDGDLEWKSCKVLGYNKETQSFIIEFPDLQTPKEVLSCLSALIFTPQNLSLGQEA